MRVLLATDLSDSAQSAARLTASLPWPAGSAIRVVSVLEPVPLALGMGPAVETGITDRIVEGHKVELRRLAGTLETPGRPVEVTVRIGRPASEIAAAARSFAADLVVIGSHGRGPFATALLGSVAAEVVDQAPCAVLVARGDGLTRIVLADDGSDGSRLAAELVMTWPFLARVPVRVVSVTDMPFFWLVPSERVAADTASMRAYLEALERGRLAHARIATDGAERLTAAGIAVTAEPREGDAAGELVAAARESGADLIVIGSRGHTGLKRLLLGSVARNVLLHAPCSVLIVRPSAALTTRTSDGTVQRLTHAGRA